MEIDGRFWLTKDGENFLGNGRIELLEHIDKTGSISASAKAMKMSYKAAWERINQMNEVADKPIIEKVIGGKGGGGTVLTDHARELIDTYKSFRTLHRQFIARFSEAGDDPKRLARILSRTFLTTSARNQLPCRIQSIKAHGINGAIELELNGKEHLWADITVTSIQNMGLIEGADVYAIIKSSDVAISHMKPENNPELNILPGIIEKIESIEDNTEVRFKLESQETLIGVVSLEAGAKLKEQTPAFATIAKHSIIIGL